MHNVQCLLVFVLCI